MDMSVQVSSVKVEMSKLLQPLDDILKCHICFDYFNNCVTTKCSHSYCSLCIRKYMMYERKCPECFQEAFESDLRNNRQIDEVLNIYNKIRDFLELPVDQKTHQLDVICPLVNKVPNSEHNLKTGHHTNADISAVSAIGSTVIDKVSYPSCSRSISSKDINSNLGGCLTSKLKSQKLRKPLPKIVYCLLTDREIKKRLRENGLSTVGDRQTLINRHKNFVVLYNAECDSLNPRPVNKIVKQIEKEECSSTNKLFQTDKKSDLSEIAQENESYLKKNKDQFDALISNIMTRGSGKKDDTNEIVRKTSSATNESEKMEEFSAQCSETDEDIVQCSPELFITTESEDENSNCGETTNNGEYSENAADHKDAAITNLSCHFSSSSSDNHTLCESMKEIKRMKRKLE